VVLLNNNGLVKMVYEAGHRLVRVALTANTLVARVSAPVAKVAATPVLV
jgi:hypothetical protein